MIYGAKINLVWEKYRNTIKIKNIYPPIIYNIYNKKENNFETVGDERKERFVRPVILTSGEKKVKTIQINKKNPTILVYIHVSR